MESVQKNILITTLIFLFLALVWAICWYIKFYKAEHFVCPKCGYTWKPPIFKLVFAVNAVEGKIINCPHCGAREYMEPTKDKS